MAASERCYAAEGNDMVWQALLLLRCSEVGPLRLTIPMPWPIRLACITCM